MKSARFIVVAAACLSVAVGCMPQFAARDDTDADVSALSTVMSQESSGLSGELADPPVYVRALHAPPHPALAQKVHVNFSPGNVALHTAIVKALPFLVTVVARDQMVDLNAPVSVRANGVAVGTYLKQLEGESGYRIELRPDESVVEVAAVVTRTWNLPALAGMGDFNARLGFGDDGDDEDDGDVERSHTMSSSVAHDDDVWATVVAHAHCILGIGGCESDETTDATDADAEVTGRPRNAGTWLVDNRRLGTISASGKPRPMALLDQWLSKMVADSLRLVRLECAILDVAVDERRAAGVDFDAVFGDDEDFVRITRGSVVSDDDDSGWTIGTVLDGGRFDLDFFIRRLARRTDVKVKSRARLVVTNAATAYLNTGEVFSYLSGIESVATEGVATTSFEQTRLQIGLELAVTPRILDDNGRMLVEVVPILSSVVRFDELGDGANRVNTPVISLRQMSSQAITRSGRPVVIGGLTWDRLASDEESPVAGTVFEKWFSSRDRKTESRQLLIVITPWEVMV